MRAKSQDGSSRLPPGGERTWTSIGRALEAFWESTREWPGISHRIVRVLGKDDVEVMAVFDINKAIFEIEEKLELRN